MDSVQNGHVGGKKEPLPTGSTPPGALVYDAFVFIVSDLRISMNSAGVNICLRIRQEWRHGVEVMGDGGYGVQGYEVQD